MSDEQIEQVCRCASRQAQLDIPYVEVVGSYPYEYHEKSDRWYVEVDVQRLDPDEGAAIALYRVWRTPSGLAAIKVNIRAVESEVQEDDHINLGAASVASQEFPEEYEGEDAGPELSQCPYCYNLVYLEQHVETCLLNPTATGET